VIQGLVAPLDCECVSDLYALCEGLRHLHHRVGTVRFAWVRRGLPAGIEGPLRVRARCSLVGALHSLEIACAVPACACWSPAVHILSFSCCVAREGRVHSAGQNFVGGERFEHPPLALSAKRCGFCVLWRRRARLALPVSSRCRCTCLHLCVRHGRACDATASR
jgi:hypothetical protein